MHTELTHKTMYNKRKTLYKTGTVFPSGEEAGNYGSVQSIAPTYYIPVQSATSFIIEESLMKFYGHSYTLLFGTNFLIVHNFNRQVQVSGYDMIERSREFRVVIAQVDLGHPQTGQV